MNKNYPFLLAAFAALGFATLASAQGPSSESPMSCCAPVQVAQATKTTHVLSDKGATAKADKSGVQKATITINGGYTPSTISVTAGKPVELTFLRKSAAGCDGELLIPGLKFDKTLKQGEKTVVKFTPKKGQSLPFSCGMHMYKGEVVVK